MNEKFSILHEAKLSAVLKISSSLYSKQVRVFENKTRTKQSLTPFNIQFEFTAGDRLTMASRATCLNEKTMNQEKQMKTRTFSGQEYLIY